MVLVSNTNGANPNDTSWSNSPRLSKRVVNQSASTYTILPIDEVVINTFAGSTTITLPSISAFLAEGHNELYIVAADTNTTINRAGTDQIIAFGVGPQNTFGLTTGRGSCRCIPIGGIWYINS